MFQQMRAEKNEKEILMNKLQMELKQRVNQKTAEIIKKKAAASGDNLLTQQSSEPQIIITTTQTQEQVIGFEDSD